MEDTTQGTPTPEQEASAPAVDEVKNLKAEMNRKLGNLEQTHAQLVSQLQAMMTPKVAETPAKKVSVFENEEAYAAQIKAEALAEVRKELSTQNQSTQKQQAVIANLIAEFPELNDGSHDLTVKAIEIFNGMTDEDKKSPIAYRAAVKEAALDLGIKPKNKRQAPQSDDGFSLGSGGGAPRAAAKKSDLDPKTEAFAKLMGLDLSKTEVKDRLKKSHGRKSYTNWE